MASLPKKGVKGANLRKWLIDSINGLIDYLHSARVRPGDGIMVKETPSGVIVSLAKKATANVNNSTGGGGMIQDISASVSGGTATVALSGSTSSVEIVGGTSGNVTISGNTNGQIEIDVQGGTSGGSIGFPDYSHAPVLDINSNYMTSFPYSEEYPYPVWLIGSSSFASSQSVQGLEIVFYPDNPSDRFSFTIAYCDYGSNYSTDEYRSSSQFSIPIPANTPFEIQITSGCIAPYSFRYRIFECIS